MTKGQPWYGPGMPPPNNNQYGYGNQYSADNSQYQAQGQYGYGQPDQNSQYGQASSQYQHTESNAQSYGQWNQGPPQQQYGATYPPSYGSEVDEFRAHFDQQPSGHNNEYYNSQQPYDQAQGPHQGSHGTQGEQGEDRGIVGALGGAAVGGFAGHKFGHHGIIGALGGAIAGSLVEDQAKKHKKEEKHKDDHRKEKHDTEHLGNFSLSSRSIRLEQGRYLVAECSDPNGHHHQSNIDLNDCLGNDNGAFRWARGGNFLGSAEDVKLKDDGTKLKAKLRTVHGDWEVDSIKLNERIGNDNGRLFFID